MDTLRQISDGSLEDIEFPDTHDLNIEIKKELNDNPDLYTNHVENNTEINPNLNVKSELTEETYYEEPDYYSKELEDSEYIPPPKKKKKKYKYPKHDGPRKIHACTICEYKSSHKENLDAHVLRVHEKVKPFKCDICNKAFSQKVRPFK